MVSFLTVGGKALHIFQLLALAIFTNKICRTFTPQFQLLSLIAENAFQIKSFCFPLEKVLCFQHSDYLVLKPWQQNRAYYKREGKRKVHGDLQTGYLVKKL